MTEWCSRFSMAVWAYGLMPNHVHLIVVPNSEGGLLCAVGEAHRRFCPGRDPRLLQTGSNPLRQDKYDRFFLFQLFSSPKSATAISTAQATYRVPCSLSGTPSTASPMENPSMSFWWAEAHCSITDPAGTQIQLGYLPLASALPFTLYLSRSFEWKTNNYPRGKGPDGRTKFISGRS